MIATVTLGTCNVCRHWQPFDKSSSIFPTSADELKFGRCTRIATVVYGQLGPEDLACTGPRGLRTVEGFGCMLWQPKEAP
jgi:hypothetical protein